MRQGRALARAQTSAEEREFLRKTTVSKSVIRTAPEHVDSTGAALSLSDCFTSICTAGTVLSSDEIDYTGLIKTKQNKTNPYNLTILSENKLRNCFLNLPFCVVESSAGSVGSLMLESACCEDAADSSWSTGAVDSASSSNINIIFYSTLSRR